jgi:elongation factor Ts
MEKAIDILRKKGQKISANRADRDATEGAVFIYISSDAKEGIAFSLNCETDFVGKNEEFLALGNSIMDVAKAHKPATAEALNALNIDDRTVLEHITDLMGKIGEKIEVSQYSIMQGEHIASYLHGDSKIGVLVNMANVNGKDVSEAGRNVGMQIASMKPIAVDEHGVDATTVQREKEIGIEKARQEGKPENILEKIAEGFVKKFYKENTLLSQEYVKGTNKESVQQYLDTVSKGLTVKAFARVAIGR